MSLTGTDNCRLTPDVIYLSNTSSVNCYSFPSTISSADGELDLAGTADPCNLALQVFADRLSKPVSAEQAFSYIYAILYSPVYRQRYFESLQYDFPRIPLVSNSNLFRRLAILGDELVALHLMEFTVGKRDESKQRYPQLTEYTGGKAVVEKVSWSKNTVWLDKAQTRGFKGVPQNVWEFHIGGYQVCEKWLKDRKGRTLSRDDIEHYHKIVIALHETIRLMAEIDKVIDAHGGWPGAFLTDKKAK